mmetsp:Transcript_40233/g.100705  ORF Transcript_40233/g.100705 Transcript_40233/m.100705 type:complete len:218 (-) Transcript_40233:274-927(-)
MHYIRPVSVSSICPSRQPGAALPPVLLQGLLSRVKKQFLRLTQNGLENGRLSPRRLEREYVPLRVVADQGAHGPLRVLALKPIQHSVLPDQTCFEYLVSLPEDVPQHLVGGLLATRVKLELLHSHTRQHQIKKILLSHPHTNILVAPPIIPTTTHGMTQDVQRLPQMPQAGQRWLDSPLAVSLVIALAVRLIAGDTGCWEGGSRRGPRREERLTTHD